MLMSLPQEDRDVLLRISNAANELGLESYVVGGYVRDRFLGRKSKDIDIVCVGDGIKLAKAAALKFDHKPRVTVYGRFGTAMFRVGERDLEFVGARKESYRSDSRKPNVEPGSLEDDQLRRDFTINALAVSLQEHDYGTVVDPFNGLSHLEEKRIQTPLEPGKTFSDDPLRMIRAIRFASQLGFEIEASTFESIRAYKDRIRIVSMERITTELNKIIMSPFPTKGFELLEQCGLLELIFPEFVKLRGAEYQDGIGHKDNFSHTLEVLEGVCRNSDDLYLRWAALLHDIGKPPTKRFDKKAGWTFHGHEVVGAAMVPRIFRRLKLPMNDRMKFVQKLVRLHLRPISLTKDSITDSAIRRLLFDAGDDLEDLMTLCEADITTKNPKRKRRFLSNYEIVRERLKTVEEEDEIRNWQPPVSGDDIMTAFDIKPSREIGIIKDAIREAILDGDIPNDRMAALQLMREKGESLGLTFQTNFKG